MTEQDYSEIHEIARRLDRWAFWARWALGALAAIALSGFSFAMLTEGRIASLEQSDRVRDGTIESLSNEISVARTQSAKRDSEVSRITAQIEAQSRTLNRIDNAISDLTRYLRDERGRR